MHLSNGERAEDDNHQAGTQYWLRPIPPIYTLDGHLDLRMHTHPETEGNHPYLHLFYNLETSNLATCLANHGSFLSFIFYGMNSTRLDDQPISLLLRNGIFNRRLILLFASFHELCSPRSWMQRQKEERKNILWSKKSTQKTDRIHGFGLWKERTHGFVPIFLLS